MFELDCLTPLSIVRFHYKRSYVRSALVFVFQSGKQIIFCVINEIDKTLENDKNNDNFT